MKTSETTSIAATASDNGMKRTTNFLISHSIYFTYSSQFLFQSFKGILGQFPDYFLGIYEIVLDGYCPYGYLPLPNEAECKALAGQTISNFGPLSFDHTGCSGAWTLVQTCFADLNNLVYFVDEDCGQNPDFSTHRLVCKHDGNNFLYFNTNFKCEVILFEISNAQKD